MIEWKPFLARWSCEIMQTELASRIEPLPESSDWLGFAAATEDEVADLEQRLGVILPPSYKAFLLTSNGWRRTTPFIARIRPTQDVNWFRVENETWADIYADSGCDMPDEEYYMYENDGGAGHRGEHMASLLQISDVGDGVYLLNLEAVTPDGEWEAWFFSNWVPGAQRFPSFAHLMLHEYRSFTQLEGIKAPTYGLLTLTMPLPDDPRVPAERIPKKAAKAPTLDALIEQMRSTDQELRARAVRTFFGKLKGRGRAKPHAYLGERLVGLFYASSDADVRCACVAGLTELAEEGAAPAPLLDALSDDNPNVVLQGIFALHYFPDRHALTPLCKFIESRANVLYNENAMQCLAEMGDERAIPTLLGVLLDTATVFDQGFSTAAYALARCGTAGVDALMRVVTHDDPRVRLAVTVGLDVSGDPRAAPHLDHLESDPDPRVRQRAKMRMGKPYWEP